MWKRKQDISEVLEIWDVEGEVRGCGENRLRTPWLVVVCLTSLISVSAAFSTSISSIRTLHCSLRDFDSNVERLA